MTAKKSKPKPRKRRKKIDWEKVARQNMHGLRLEILEIYAAGGVFSPNELSKALNAELSNVSYHVRVLVEGGQLKLTRTKPVRGAVEHFYEFNG